LGHAERADADTDEAFYLVTELVEHEANLALETLAEDHADHIGGDLADGLGLCASAFDGYAPEQPRGVCRAIVGAVEEDLVLLLDLETRMGEAEAEVAIIGEDEKALAVEIEAADVEQAGPVGGHQLEDRAAIVGIGGGAEEASCCRP
jgi:hypothetical protein